MTLAGSKNAAPRREVIRKSLGSSPLVLVGLMGCGKSTVGRRLASALKLPFKDADAEIEAAASKSISEIFSDEGEAFFRDRERLVIARLLSQGPMVLATGGGAFMHQETRSLIQETGISIWLKADLPVLMKRVMRRNNRPLLKTGNPSDIMRSLMDERYPVYGLADITVVSRDASHETVVNDITDALEVFLKRDDGRDWPRQQDG